VQKQFVNLLVVGLLGLAVSACSSRKKADESEVPAIDSNPMSFDPQGSDSGRIPGLETVFFDFDSSTLTPRARRTLEGNAQWLRTNSRVNMQIEGHCDERGSTEYNLALGERRAKAVMEYLVNAGIDRNRLSIVSYGKERPLERGDTEAIHARNRRANFVPLQ
jgi:peptidoglycan-associated lipoprotein